MAGVTERTEENCSAAELSEHGVHFNPPRQKWTCKTNLLIQHRFGRFVDMLVSLVSMTDQTDIETSTDIATGIIPQSCRKHCGRSLLAIVFYDLN
jgi:hypothetical protein